MTNSTAKLSPRSINRGEVLTACFPDKQSQRSIRMEFVIITPPARRAWRSYKFASLDFSGFFSVSEVGLPLMGDTAGYKLHEPI